MMIFPGFTLYFTDMAELEHYKLNISYLNRNQQPNFSSDKPERISRTELRAIPNGTSLSVRRPVELQDYQKADLFFKEYFYFTKTPDGQLYHIAGYSTELIGCPQVLCLNSYLGKVTLLKSMVAIVWFWLFVVHLPNSLTICSLRWCILPWKREDFLLFPRCLLLHVGQRGLETVRSAIQPDRYQVLWRAYAHRCGRLLPDGFLFVRLCDHIQQGKAFWLSFVLT